MNKHPFIALACGFGLVLVLRRIIRNRRCNPRHLSHPPGPKGLPFLGNLAELNQPQPWEVYNKLCQQYGAYRVLCLVIHSCSGQRFSGDMVWLEAMGQGILVVGSLERAFDLLDRKSLNYSDRPSIPLMEL